MNKDQVKGRIKEAKGKVKIVAGKVTGNEKLQQKEKTQNGIGKFWAGDVDQKEGIKKTIQNN